MKTFLLLSLAILGQALSPSSHITAADRNRLKAVFSQSCDASAEIASIHYSVLGLQLLGEPVPNKDKLCAAVAKLSDDSSVENLYAASGTAAALGCSFTLGPKAKEAVKTNTGEGSTSASIFFAVKTLKSTGSKPDKAIAKSLASAIKKDDSLLSLGLAFHVASLLDGDMNPIFERVEDAIVQADEVDGKMLQFEGGLSVTSIILTGAAKLASKVKKPLPLTGEQAVKFSNYLLSRKSVQQAKGALHLLEGIESFSGDAQFTPVSISLVSSVAVDGGSPNVIVSVTDLKGASPGDMKVTLDSATRTQDDAVIATKKVLSKTGSNYQVDLMGLKPAPGFYDLVLSAAPAKPNAKFVGNTEVKLSVKVLFEQSVQNVELKVLDSDQSTAGRSQSVTYPAKVSSKVKVHHKEKIQLTFNVEDSAGAKLLVHQAFVKIAHSKSAAEIVYVAEADNNKLYKFELDLGADAAEFKASGDYSLTLILGDAVVSNPISWLVADLELSLPEGGQKEEPGIYQPKPEITHLFREPEARPPQIVSTVFTLLSLSPLLLLLGLWAKLGANLGNFSPSLSCLGFHLGLGAIFVLYLMFWLELNMFETVRYLVLISIVTFLCGNSLLANIAKKNK